MRAPSVSSLGIVVKPGQSFRRAKKTDIVEEKPELAASVQSIVKSQTKIFIKGLEIEAECGVYAFEKGVKRLLVLDIDIVLTDQIKVQNDDLDTTLDYDFLVDCARKIAATGHFNLIETYAEALADAVLRNSKVQEARILVNKPGAVKGAVTSGVEITRIRSSQ